jgi:hypothetical protein
MAVMESRDLQSPDELSQPVTEDDPELAREFEAWAEWLLNLYLSKLKQKRKAGGTKQVDTGPPSHTM